MCNMIRIFIITDSYLVIIVYVSVSIWVSRKFYTQVFHIMIISRYAHAHTSINTLLEIIEYYENGLSAVCL